MVSAVAHPGSGVAFVDRATALFSSLENKITAAQSNALKALIPSSQTRDVSRFSKLIDFSEGGIWGVFCLGNAYFSYESLKALYDTITLEDSTSSRFEKIGFAVKTAFVDLLSFLNSFCYTVSWAGKVGILTLFKYLPLIDRFSFGTSILTNGIEAGADIYQIYTEKNAILAEQQPAKKEMHKRYLVLNLMKLISNVSMVAWGCLGIAAITGLAISTPVSMVLLAIGSVVGVAAYFYKAQIETDEKKP